MSKSKQANKYTNASNLTVTARELFNRKLSPNANLLTPSEAGYSESLKRWADNAIRPAGLVVQVANAQDVSETVKWVTANNFHLAVKGGGHSCSGFSSSDGGVVIDLSQLRLVSVDAERKLIMAGGGALWQDVDSAACEKGFATVGGTVNNTGVGGLTLGGGFGYLTGQYGLTIDNLVEVEIVLADGSIHTVNEHHMPDLFWAIRGAGNKFGCVTKFTFKAHEIPDKVWGGLLRYPEDQLEAVIDAAEDFMQKGNPKSAALAVATPGPDNNPTISLVTFYQGDEAEARQIFSRFLSIPHVLSTVQMRPYNDMNGLLNNGIGYGERRMFTNANVRHLHPATFRRAFDILISSTDPNTEGGIPNANRSSLLMPFLPTKALESKRPDETAFAFRDSLVDISIACRWNDEKIDAKVMALGRELQNIILKDGDSNRMYYNLSDGTEASAKEVGSNYERLRELKVKYDPTDVFRSL